MIVVSICVTQWPLLQLVASTGKIHQIHIHWQTVRVNNLLRRGMMLHNELLLLLLLKLLLTLKLLVVGSSTITL